MEKTKRNAIRITLLATCAMSMRYACAQQADPVALGDEWVYRQVVESVGKPALVVVPRFKVNYVNKQGEMVVGVTPSDSSGGTPVWHPAYFLDSSACLLDMMSGESLRTEQACTLPESGKSWAFDDRNSVSSVQERYTVLGKEMVQVAAGNYDAIKVAVQRTETEVPYPGVETAPPKRSHTVYWFAPEAKAAVKVVRERFDPSGARTSVQTDELQRFGNVKPPK